MKIEWPIVRLKDHVDLLSGYAVKSDQFSQDPNGMALVKGENVSQGSILWNIAKRWHTADLKILNKFQLKPGDVIVAMDRPWVPAGLKWAFIRKDDPKAFLVQRCCRLRTKDNMLDQTFLRFIVGSPDFENYIRPITTGVNVPHLSGQQILDYQFALPPIAQQRQIAEVLSSYDELIENSQHRISILEELGRRLYREWFVHFRFPGHKNRPRMQHALGEIPEGWEVRKLSDIVSTQYGYTESAQETAVGPRYLRGMDINKSSYIDWSEVPYCPISSEDLASYRLSKGDILVIRMADPGKVGIVEQDVDAVFASYLIRIKSKANCISPYHLFYLMESPEYYSFITGAATGTTRKSASAGLITDFHVILPPRTLSEAFQEHVGELRKLLTNRLLQKQNLRRTRDLLLSSLLSGQIELERS